MNAAITSVYSVIAVCTPWIDVSRSSTICEIATFMTLESSTITNCAEARIIIGSHLRIRHAVQQFAPGPASSLAGDLARQRRRLAALVFARWAFCSSTLTFASV